MKQPMPSKEPMPFVDPTPDEAYPLRILKAYRADCDLLWTDDTTGAETTNPLYRLMNEHQRQRAEILDRAIRKLEKEA